MIDDATLTEWERSEYPWAAEMAREIRRLSAEKEEFDLAEHRHTIPFLGKQTTCEEVIRRLQEEECLAGQGAIVDAAIIDDLREQLAAHRAVVRELAEAAADARDAAVKILYSVALEDSKAWADEPIRGRLNTALARPLVQQAREEKA